METKSTVHKGVNTSSFEEIILNNTGLLIFHRKKRKISRDFQGQIRGKIGRFRGILAEESQISKDFRGKFLEKSADFTGNFGGKLRQETISKKQPISLDFFWQISLKSINFASI